MGSTSKNKLRALDGSAGRTTVTAGMHLKIPALKWFMGTLIVAAAFAFRLAYIDANPFSVDEAESSINALTILQHGYPTDTYLGLPIYENISTQPWPGNPEYSFRM